MKAVLVFCEGAHDVAFAQRCLGAAGCKWWPETGTASIDELPTPFGRSSGTAYKGIIEQHYTTRRVHDLSFSSASRAPAPIFDSVLLRERDTYYYLLRTEGDAKSSQNQKLLTMLHLSLEALREAGADCDTRQVAHAFLFDADSIGVAGREREFVTQYEEFFGFASMMHAGWQPTIKGPVGLWVHHDIARPDRSGTLEDLLAPMFADAIPDRWGAADEYIGRHARDDDPVHRKRIKAQITIAGQMARPGDPMSEMLRRPSKDRRELLPRAAFLEAGPARDLAQFLIDVPWA